MMRRVIAAEWPRRVNCGSTSVTGRELHRNNVSIDAEQRPTTKICALGRSKARNICSPYFHGAIVTSSSKAEFCRVKGNRPDCIKVTMHV
jgi:hypothetical protein